MSSPAPAIGASNPRIRPRSPEQEVRATPPLRQEKPTTEYLDAQMLELKKAMDNDRKEYEDRRAKSEQRMEYMMGLVNATKELQKGNAEAENFIAAQMAELQKIEGADTFEKPELPGQPVLPGDGPQGQPGGEEVEAAAVPLPKSSEVPENFELRTPTPAGVDSWHATGASPWPVRPGTGAASSGAGSASRIQQLAKPRTASTPVC